ncbi:TPA: PagK family vesicle-borne virulence factor, partial [Salmonella enterica]|nr:hypothetical protein [Salmonella enterica subsp. enterica]EKQ2855366.1 hypothetical protein [Salmonella enterica]
MKNSIFLPLLLVLSATTF